eukprot:gnl/Carplike_NY0171/3082_a4139_632.p1 GENE.gnl/Carplike_NY0171/3082_a4139_632~~gnl/Carplike_NY0171/3082_a4139_632.p1  ORF type:complete len:269 (-),score=42.50 gnl/Carplike_NY0171/3082_a4139_632:120-905(-)
MGLGRFFKGVWFLFVTLVIFYIYLPTFIILSIFKNGFRKTPYIVSHHVFKIFKVKKYEINLPNIHILSSFQGVIFTTHKGWFDFFYSAIAADAAQFGRLAVFIAFPPALMCHLISNFCLVYHRAKKGKKSDKQKLAKLGDSVDTYIHRKNPRLLVFPEGHRNRKGRGLQELRTGFLRICFEKKINIFVMPTEGSQHIFNEFTLSTRRNQPLVINYSGVVLPTDYSSWNDFHDAVLAKMKKGYDECCEYYDEITEAKVSKDD